VCLGVIVSLDNEVLTHYGLVRYWGGNICTTLYTHRSNGEIWVSHSGTGYDSSLVMRGIV
jgi:hypothetical protein